MDTVELARIFKHNICYIIYYDIQKIMFPNLFIGLYKCVKTQ